jgi:hypothetical protein
MENYDGVEIFEKKNDSESREGRLVPIIWEFKCGATQDQREAYEDCSLHKYKPKIDAILCQNRRCQYLLRRKTVDLGSLDVKFKGSGGSL